MRTLEISTDARGVVYVTLDRPEKRNALSAEMIADLTEMATTIGGSSKSRAIVLKGRGKAFCAGTYRSNSWGRNGWWRRNGLRVRPGHS